ncbi:hypothetical protein KCU71_g7426, partial [Aureobasidium melanogenum]
MTNYSSVFHPRPTVNGPPRKRAKRFHQGHSYETSEILPGYSLPLTIMAEPRVTANTNIPHASLGTVSNKIKRLQSDLSSAASGECFGPGKQKVLDCKHDVDVLAGMVKELEVQSVARKRSLKVLLEASIDQLFDTYVDKAFEVVDENTEQLIRYTLYTASHKQNIKDVIKNGLNNEPDMLLDFEAKFERYFKEALANAVARSVAGDVLFQLKEI